MPVLQFQGHLPAGRARSGVPLLQPGLRDRQLPSLQGRNPHPEDVPRGQERKRDLRAPTGGGGDERGSDPPLPQVQAAGYQRQRLQQADLCELQNLNVLHLPKGHHRRQLQAFQRSPGKLFYRPRSQRGRRTARRQPSPRRSYSEDPRRKPKYQPRGSPRRCPGLQFESTSQTAWLPGAASSLFTSGTEQTRTSDIGKVQQQSPR